jgi:hypothetical protein
MSHFFLVSHPVVRKGHDALPTEETITTLRAVPRCLQVLRENEVFGLQRVKHRDLRETVAVRVGYVPVLGGTKHSTRP